MSGASRPSVPGRASRSRRSRTATKSAARSPTTGCCAKTCGRCAGRSRSRSRTSRRFSTFDAADPFASRCVDEDFNRLWTAEVLDGERQTRDLARARAVAPGLRRNRLSARPALDDRSLPAAGAWRTAAEGTGARARRRRARIHHDRRRPCRRASGCATTAAFDDPVDPTKCVADRMRPALGARWRRTWRSRRRCASCATSACWTPHSWMRHLDAAPLPRAARDRGDRRRDHRDRRVRVRSSRSTGLTVIPKGGTLLARDGATRSLHAVRRRRARSCRRGGRKKGETAVRIGRFVS